MTLSLASSKILKGLPDCPKDPAKNIAYRAKVNDWAVKSRDHRMAFVEKLRQNTGDSLIWFNDTFSMTQNVIFRENAQESINCPMVSFPEQEEFFRWVHAKVMAQKSWGSRKSRGWGLTWTVSVVWDYEWLVDPNALLLVASQNEAKVDNAKNPDAIMKKMDYHIKNLPQWLKDELIPGYEPRIGTKFRAFRAMQNPLTGGVIIGEPTTGDLARGGRKTAGFIDEAAAVDNLEDIVKSVALVTKSMGYFSTDKGLARKFAQMWQQNSIEFYKGKVGTPWQTNPFFRGYTKWPDGVNGKLESDDIVAKRTGGVFMPGETYLCTKDCALKHHKDGGKEHSDEYDEACKRLSMDSKAIAEELDMEPAVAGGSVFDVERIKRVIDMLQAQIGSGNLKFDTIGLDFIMPPNQPATQTEEEYYMARAKWPVYVSNRSAGPFRIWKWPFSCQDKACVCGGTGKHVYVIGGDTSSGYATSDGCGGAVLDATAGEIVADVHGQYHAQMLAKLLILLGKFYGTSSGNDIDAYYGIESNHEGATVCRIVDQHGMLMHVSKTQNSIKKGTSGRLGVVMAGNKNDVLAAGIEKVINCGEGLWPPLVCPFIEYWHQMLTFIECATNTKDQKAEKTRKAAQKNAKDDRVMILNHAVYASTEYYGNWKGVLRPDEMRLKQVNFALDTSLNNLQSVVTC